MTVLQKKEENMMINTYFKKNNGITMTSLIITIVVLLILAGVGIAAMAPGGLTERAETIREDYKVREVIQEVHNNLDYKYYSVFKEELGTGESEDLVEQIAELSIELDLPTDVFTIYGEKGEANNIVKKIYYRYDKVVHVKKEDNSNYTEYIDSVKREDYGSDDEYTNKIIELEEEIMQKLGPNDKEKEIMKKLEDEGIEYLKGDVNFDGILTNDDQERITEIINWENVFGFQYGPTYIESKLADVEEDEYLDVTDISNLSRLIIQ